MEEARRIRHLGSRSKIPFFGLAPHTPKKCARTSKYISRRLQKTVPNPRDCCFCSCLVHVGQSSYCLRMCWSYELFVHRKRALPDRANTIEFLSMEHSAAEAHLPSHTVKHTKSSMGFFNRVEMVKRERLRRKGPQLPIEPVWSATNLTRTCTLGPSSTGIKTYFNKETTLYELGQSVSVFQE